MSFRVRPATGEDFAAIYEMAKLTGGGFTNLPPDRATLVQKLARSDDSFSREEDSQSDDLYVFVLEDPKAGIIRGTCQVFGQVGVRQPFYSYHLSTLTQTSPELGKTFRNQTLTLTTDLEGVVGSRRPVPSPERPRRRLGRTDCAQPLPVHQEPSRAVRQSHPRRASRSDGRSRQCALLGRARGPLLRHDLPGSGRVQRRPRHAIHCRPDAQDADLRRRCSTTRRGR